MAKKVKFVSMSFRPNSVPDGLAGRIAVICMTRHFVEFILRIHEQLDLLCIDYHLYQVVFFHNHGEWYSTLGAAADAELADAEGWVETPALWQESSEDPPDAQGARSATWTIGIGREDIVIKFYERHCTQELESPALPIADVRAMLDRLE